MSRRWSDETTCTFVELYKEYECLWNMNITLYRNKNAREAAIVKIIESMGMENFTTEDVKQKIKSLRGTYQQELFKVERSEKSGAGLDDVYKPSMKWYYLMDEIMKSGNVKRNTLNNMVSTYV